LVPHLSSRPLSRQRGPVAGLLLVCSKAAYNAIGCALLVAAVVLQLVRRRTMLTASA